MLDNNLITLQTLYKQLEQKSYIKGFVDDSTYSLEKLNENIIGYYNNSVFLYSEGDSFLQISIVILDDDSRLPFESIHEVVIQEIVLKFT